MAIEVTTQQLRERALRFIDLRTNGPEVSLPNTNLCPQLVDCDGPAQSLELSFHTQPWMTNPMGVVHGGIIAVMLDNAMGITSYCLCQSATPTINLNINYVRPVPLGQVVHVRTRAMSCGSTTAHLTAEIFLPADPKRVLVSATGVYYTRQTKR